MESESEKATMERREKNWKEIKIGNEREGQKEEERKEMRNEKMRRKRRE